MRDRSKVTPIRSVAKAAENGSRRDLLVALKDRLWEAVHDERTQPRDLSPLTLRLKELHAEITALDEAEEWERERLECGDEPWDPEAV
jgi:tRNA(Arg) A34 adenosine deaminase TadA